MTEEAVAAMDAVDLDAGSAADALLYLLTEGMAAAGRHDALVRRAAAVPVSAAADRARHDPVAARIRRVVARGQRDGEFDRALPVDWLVTVVVALGHAAAAEVDAGRMAGRTARRALRVSLLRVLGVAD